jgi:hypothetical protein
MKPDQDAKIDFLAAATLKKWPSVNKERVSPALGARPYTIITGTLDECIQKFISQSVSQHHLYEIHTAPQADLVSAILSADHVVELARLSRRLTRPPVMVCCVRGAQMIRHVANIRPTSSPIWSNCNLNLVVIH